MGGCYAAEGNEGAQRGGRLTAARMVEKRTRKTHAALLQHWARWQASAIPSRSSPTWTARRGGALRTRCSPHQRKRPRRRSPRPRNCASRCCARQQRTQRHQPRGPQYQVQPGRQCGPQPRQAAFSTVEKFCVAVFSAMEALDVFAWALHTRAPLARSAAPYTSATTDFRIASSIAAIDLYYRLAVKTYFGRRSTICGKSEWLARAAQRCARSSPVVAEGTCLSLTRAGNFRREPASAVISSLHPHNRICRYGSPLRTCRR
jgi:hypothetical protein